jgi:hypothetical protein
MRTLYQERKKPRPRLLTCEEGLSCQHYQDPRKESWPPFAINQEMQEPHKTNLKETSFFLDGFFRFFVSQRGPVINNNNNNVCIEERDLINKKMAGYLWLGTRMNGVLKK